MTADFWDAHAYDKVSDIQKRWGLGVIEKRKWIGSEIVMDAGAGSGRLTEVLARKVPHGRVYAVDGDPNMVNQARINLSSCHNVAEIIQSSIEDVNLPEKVDVVFSNAVMHWLLSHERAFGRFWGLLKPGGELLIQCGGFGNLHDTLLVLDGIRNTDKFKEYFIDWKKPWHFAKPDDTEKLLQKTGFRDISVYLSNERPVFPGRQEFSMFVKTVVAKPFLSRIISAELKDQFLDEYIDRVERSNNGWSLSYVRLNICARK